MPGGLHPAPPRVAQRRLQQGLPRPRHPLAHDPQLGLRLYGDVQPHRPDRAVHRAADPEAAPPLPVRPGAPRDVSGGFAEDLLQPLAAARRASAAYASNTPDLPLPLGPAIKVSGPRGKAARQCVLKADSLNSVTIGRSPDALMPRNVSPAPHRRTVPSSVSS